MYRQYENPQMLEEKLETAKRRRDKLAQAGLLTDDMAVDMAEEIEYLEQRINFAYQDEEYEENCKLYGGY